SSSCFFGIQGSLRLTTGRRLMSLACRVRLAALTRHNDLATSTRDRGHFPLSPRLAQFVSGVVTRLPDTGKKVFVSVPGEDELTFTRRRVRLDGVGQGHRR